jgi:hypothetical protein
MNRRVLISGTLSDSIHSFNNPGRGGVGNSQHGVGGQVGVSLCCASLFVAEHFSDQEQRMPD